MSFYKRTIKQLLQRGLLKTGDAVLIVCAGEHDQKTFLENGFLNVTISNLSPHDGVKTYDPYEWKYIDAEAIEALDNSYDWVVVHAGLHHCASPHKAFCEMLRVCKKGVCVFEARDSWLLGMGIKAGLVPKYELEPVVLSNGQYGGYRNTSVPNYVYRWTEVEVVKTCNSFLPHANHAFHFFHDYRLPIERLSMAKQKWKQVAAKALAGFESVLKALLPKQGNEFAFVVEKNLSLKPWIVLEAGVPEFNVEYGKKHYSAENFQKDQERK